MRLVRIAPFFVAMLLLILSAQAALGHAIYVSSEPGEGANVASAPSNVTVTLSEDLDPASSTLEVVGPNGQDVTDGTTEISTSDPVVATVAIKDGGAGTYTVHWHALSDADKHATEGSFTFTVGAAGQIAPATGHAQSGFSMLQGSVELAIGLGGLLLLTLGGALRLRRARY